MVLSSADPLQVLLWRGGVVPFGPARAGNGSCRAAADAPGGPPDQAAQAGAEQDELVVNLWRNRGDAVIWDMEHLEAHLETETGSGAAFQRLWHGVERGVGARFAPLCPCVPRTSFAFMTGASLESSSPYVQHDSYRKATGQAPGP